MIYAVTGCSASFSFFLAIFNGTSNGVFVRAECERGTIKAEEMHKSLARRLLSARQDQTREGTMAASGFLKLFFVAYGGTPSASIVLEM